MVIFITILNFMAVLKLNLLILVWTTLIIEPIYIDNQLLDD
jgi:hypothetical protein